MKCDKCKFGIPKRDVFTGKVKYICGNGYEIAVPPTNDFTLADSDIVIDCKVGIEKGASLVEPAPPCNASGVTGYCTISL